LLEESNKQNQFITGLIFIDPSRPPYQETMDMVETPLARLSDEQIRPSREALDRFMKKVFSA
jgi:2-oxoglutarate ferredoxin oxidoreductase subunit beta